MDSNAVADRRETWLHTQPLRLREGVEIITGAGGRTMLVSPAGKFLNISASGITVLRRLESGMTGHDLIAGLSSDHPDQAASIASAVPAFLTDLRQAGVLNVEPEPRSGRERFTRLGKADPVKRFPLVHDPNRFTAPIAATLAAVPARLLCAVVLGIPVAAIPLIVAALLAGAPAYRPSIGLIAGALAVMTCEIAIHECWHAIAMAYNGVRSRNAGFGLLFYLIPIAYVDRTDSYRHQGRFGRVVISLIGPVSDLCWAGVSAVVILSCSGQIAGFFHLLLLLQLLSVLANINPLFPSDGYHAIEAALGSINMRGRALTYVLHKLSSTPMPGYLRKVPARVRAGYVGYVIVSLAYTLLVLAGILVNLLALAARLVV